MDNEVNEDIDTTDPLSENAIMLVNGTYGESQSIKYTCYGADCNNKSFFECTSCKNKICIQHARKIVNKNNKIVCEWCGFKEQHEIATEWDQFYNCITTITECRSVRVHDYFGNRKLRLILFSVIFMICSVFSFVYQLQTKHQNLIIIGDICISFASSIPLVMIVFNKSNTNIGKLLFQCCSVIVIIGSILFFICIAMDLSYKSHLVIAMTTLFVGIDINIMNKLENILNNICWRIVIFSVILIVNGCVILVECFIKKPISSISRSHEVGWWIIVISCLLMLVILKYKSKCNIFVLNFVIGVMLVVASVIVLINACYLSYQKDQSILGNISMVCIHMVSFVNAVIIAWDIQAVNVSVVVVNDRNKMDIIHNMELEY
eukprot:465464_1